MLTDLFEVLGLGLLAILGVVASIALVSIIAYGLLSL